MVLSCRPTIVLASLNYCADSAAEIQVERLNVFEACDTCHGITRDPMDSPELELIRIRDNFFEELDKHGWLILLVWPGVK